MDTRDPRKDAGASVEKPRSREQLERDLEDAKLLQGISIELIHEIGTSGIYKKIVEAASMIMDSQFATMQKLVTENEADGKLQLLATSGFTKEAEKFWEWVYHHTASSCGEALRTKRRAIIPNFNTCEFMKGAPTLPLFQKSGILAAQSTPLYSRDGRLVGMISTHWNHPHTPSERDLSLLDILARQAADLIERNQIMEALRESEERLLVLSRDLEKKVEERTKELQRSNEDLQKFAHVASHDLKEPVRKVTTFAFRMQDDLLKGSTQNLSRYTTKIIESAQRMATMIEGVLQYSSINALEESYGVVDLNNILSSIRIDLEVLINEKNAKFEYEKLPCVKGVELLIYHVFNNIINNSLKFSKESEPPLIRIEYSMVCAGGVDCAKITVSDNGIGFDSRYNSAIFKTFTRLHSKDVYDGAGLGLSLAKNIVERHNGTIEADGKDGIGATVVVTLPIA